MSTKVKPQLAWLLIHGVLRKHYKNPDTDAARLLCASLACHTLEEFLPAWFMAIAPPGSMKTDFLESFRNLPRVHFIDEITPNTFLSGKVDQKGQKRKTPASLLHRIGQNGVLIAGDFSTFTANPKTLTIILSQLRRIYDGHFSREFGTDENLDERSWKGRITVLAGATPEIDRHYALFQSLGERFIRVRWPRAGGVETGLKAIRHTGEVAIELRAAVRALMFPILSEPQVPPVIPYERELRISHLSELIALARTHVERDGHNREAIGVPVTEGNTRLPQQLSQIARGSALIAGRSEITGTDYALACRAGFDSLPPARRAVLGAVLQDRSPHSLELPKSTISRAVEDLELAGVIEHSIHFSERVKDLLAGAGFPTLGGWEHSYLRPI